MRPLLTCGLLFFFIYGCVAPPVTEQKKKKHDKGGPENNEIDDQAFDVEYKRYLQEVVNILEKDDDFKSRLEKADPDDIKSGKIAKDIEFVNHNVRSKLDELKRQELERLRQAAMRQYEHDNGIDRRHMKIPAHVDPNNPHTFEAEDLRKLIVQTTRDLEEADRRRKEEFKEYEMRKELEYQEQLKRMDEKNREDAEKHHKDMMEKHKKHKPLHHPGSKPQFEEVWEEQDHLSPEDFNPKTFFHLHDLDGNGYWDANEVKALFKKELDKMYDPNAPEDDMKERMEEMERMREHVFNETDQNKDQLISYQEFVDQTKKQEFERDEGWEPLDQHQQYTPEEYQQYASAHEEEIRRMMEQGLIPPAPPGYVPVILPPGAQIPHGAQPLPHGAQLHGQGHHPGPVQGGHHMPPPGVHPNAIPQGQGYHHDPQQMQHLQAQQHQAYQQQLQHQQGQQMHYNPQEHHQVAGGMPPHHQQQQIQYQQPNQGGQQQQIHHQQQAYQQAPPQYQNHPSPPQPNNPNQQPIHHQDTQQYQQQVPGQGAPVAGQQQGHVPPAPVQQQQPVGQGSAQAHPPSPQVPPAQVATH